MTYSQVIVTGAAGWLGRGLLRTLAQQRDLAEKARIRAADLPDRLQAAAVDTERVQPVAADICDPGDCRALMHGAEGGLVFHLAGVIHPRRVADFQRINVGGVRQILEAAEQAGVRRIIVMSSNSPLGCNPHPDHLFDERSPYQPYMGYGRSKMQMEQRVREASERGHLETTVIRAPWFYGPLQPPRQKLFFEMIRDGKVPIVGDGQNLRSMAYIDNLAAGLVLAARAKQAAGESYWLADRRPYTMNEIVDTIENLLENEFHIRCAHKRVRLPGLASEVALGIDRCLQALGLYAQKIHVLSEMNKTIACSIAKAESELGYDPAIELREGMRRSLQEVAANGFGR